MPNYPTNYVFVCGGVLSGVGKGIVTASLGLLLKSKGYKVTAVKIDPYMNIDAGLMRPVEHGEVFVTEDGAEIDQDLGNYERFLGIEFTKNNNITSGKVYNNIINKERAMFYGGRDVEMFPDVINEVKEMIIANVTDEDFCLVEVGGTSGDVENLPFLHAIRELGKDFPAVYIMVTYLPFLRSVGELKTKPTQHAVARIREVGVFPDFIVTRNEIPVDEPRRETIAKRCFIDIKRIIDNPDLDCIYEIPLLFEKSGFADELLVGVLSRRHRKTQIEKWRKFVENLMNSPNKLKIGIVGKYVMHGNSAHKDTYISVVEAVNHAAGNLGFKPEIEMISSERYEKDQEKLKELNAFDAIIIPQGWGSRGSEGKINTIKYIRENKIPYLGLCYGMQMACIEFARNVIGLRKANSEEIDPYTKDPIIHIMPDQKEYLAKQKYGGTIRLGGWDCVLKKHSQTYQVYKRFNGFKDIGTDLISERHRHRYEFNESYKQKFIDSGMVISGTSPDGKLVEFIELPKKDHPFFIGTQGHPEYKSQPMKPHPLFLGLINAASDRKKIREFASKKKKD